MMMNAMQQTTLQHRRGRSLGSANTAGNERDEDLVLFHEMQKRERAAVYTSVAQTLQKDPSTIASLKSKAVQDDIFSSSEWDKNDYDWLLTPPATPLIPNIDHEAVGNGYSLSGVASARSLLKTTSRLGISRSEPPSRAEPTSRVVRGTLGLQQPANATAALSSSTNSIRRSLSSSTNVTMRSSTPSSSVNARSSTPVSQPVARPSTPSRSAGAPRVSTSSASTGVRPSTPTGRSATIPSNRSASSSGSSAVSSTRPTSSSATMPSNRPASSSMPSATIASTRPGISSMPSATIASTRPGSSSSRASTPVKRPATPTRTTNPPSASIRSSSVTKASTMPSSKSAASSRPSSPANRARQPASHPAVLPGFSQEPPPNLRTSMPDRPLSNSRGSVASRVGGTRSTQPEVANDSVRNMRLSSSPLVTRGRVSSDSVNSDKSSIRNGKPHDTLPTALSNGMNSKMVDRNAPIRKPLVLSEKQSAAVSLQVKKPIKSTPVRDVKPTTPSVRESSGFGRNLSKKSLDMALRHMDIRKNTPSGYKSFMSNVPASSLYSVRSGNGRGLSSSSVADSPMATSSNASSEHSMSIVIDREGSEVGDEMLSEKGSKASSISQPDSYNERRVSSWLGSPHYVNGHNTDILQVFEQGIERLSNTESPLISHYEGTMECDNFTLEPIQ
eukprot:c24333_g1_i1 orf=451-2469(-)